MASPTKNRTSFYSAHTVTAGTGVNADAATWLDFSTKWQGSIDIKVTNGATGPTIGLEVQVQIANDYNGGSPTLPVNYGGQLQCGTANSEVDYFSVAIPDGCSAVRIVCGGNTAQNVTIDADIGYMTAFA